MRSLSALCLILGLCSSEVILAQKSGKKPAEESSEEKAAKISKEATKALKAKEYEKALAGFQEAYALVPSAVGFLVNIGICYQNLSEYAKAKDAYIKFLANAPADDPLRPKAAEKLVEVNAIIAELPKEPTPIAPAETQPATIGAVVIAPMENSPPKKPSPLLLASGASGVGALAVGSFAGLSFLKGRDEESAVQESASAGDSVATKQHLDRMGLLYQRANTLSIVGAVLGVSTAGLFVAGLVTRPAREVKASVLISSNSAALSFTF